MKTIVFVVITIALAISGCSSLNNAGTAEYSIKPFLADKETDKVLCCEVVVKNGKEIANLEASITKTGDDYSITLKEQGVAAFKGQEVSAGALTAAIDAAVRAAMIPFAAPVIGSGLQLLR